MFIALNLLQFKQKFYFSPLELTLHSWAVDIHGQLKWSVSFFISYMNDIGWGFVGN